MNSTIGKKRKQSKTGFQPPVFANLTPQYLDSLEQFITGPKKAKEEEPQHKKPKREGETCETETTEKKEIVVTTSSKIVIKPKIKIKQTEQPLKKANVNEITRYLKTSDTKAQNGKKQSTF